MKARQHAAIALLAVAGTAAQAQNFALEGAVIDSRSSQNLGVVSERGAIAGVFRAQKAMTFGILRAAGISLEQLPPEVRARIERFQTTNVEAFRAFSDGLDLKDQGRFAEARERFRRAAELDPGFVLAAEQQRSMPDVNLGGSIQIRTVVAAAAGAAVDKGKGSFTVDVSRAMAAIQAGQVVVVVTAAPTEQPQGIGGGNFTSNPAGSGAQFSSNLVAGLSYAYANAPGSTVGIANVNEWRADKYRVAGGVLESAGSNGDFLAQRLGASVGNTGQKALADGSTAYWGTWQSTPGASAAVTVSGVARTAPALGPADFVIADATRTMPGTGTAVFSPAGGGLTNPSGTIAVDFLNRRVDLQNLGFDIAGLRFSGLAGSAPIDARIASGAFSGNYSAGQCNGCSGFTPLSSAFGGNFVGKNADGLVFSTIMLTNGSSVSGVHLFAKP